MVPRHLSSARGTAALSTRRLFRTWCGAAYAAVCERRGQKIKLSLCWWWSCPPAPRPLAVPCDVHLTRVKLSRREGDPEQK